MGQQQNQGAQRASLTLEEISDLLRAKLGDENLRDGGLATALIADGSRIGKSDAVIAFAKGLGGAGGTLEIEHKLGRVPGYCRLVTTIPPAGATGAHVSVAPVKYEKWTDTTLRVDTLLVGAGSLDGTIIVLEVGGHRVG